MVTLPSISRALKTARRAVFAPRDADAGLRLAVTASGCAPWAGLAFCDRCACSGFLFPPQAAVASAAGCSIPVLLYSLQCIIKRKKLNQRQIVKDFLIKFTKIYKKGARSTVWLLTPRLIDYIFPFSRSLQRYA